MMNSTQTYLKINSCDSYIIVKIDSSQAFSRALQNSTFWQAFIPTVGVEQIDEPNTLSDLIVTEDSTLSYDVATTPATVHVDTNRRTDAIVMAGYLLEKRRQENGLYTMHGSLIAKDDGAIALIGGVSGIGKTSLAAFAANQGWQFAADEKFVVDNRLKIQGGVERTLDDEKTQNTLAWHEHTEPAFARPLQLKAVVIPIATNESELTSHQLSTQKAYWHIYEEMTRDIRLLNGLVDNFTVPLPSLDTTELATHRAQCAQAIAASVPVFYYRGTHNAILQQLDTLVIAN